MKYFAHLARQQARIAAAHAISAAHGLAVETSAASMPYAWSPEEVVDFGRTFRALFPDGCVALEHSMGHIPVGEGGDDYRARAPGQDPHRNPGRLQDFDLVLGEFGFTDADVHSDNSWQILGRMLGPDYRRPSDQPSGDDPRPPHYLPQDTPRGPFGYWVFETDTYPLVHSHGDPAIVQAAERHHAYFASMGARDCC